MPRPTFEQACAAYLNRFTMEHIPSWAKLRTPNENGTFYAPQYRSDREWYNLTTFPGEPEHLGGRNHCYSKTPTWPLGQWLDKPFKAQA